MNSENLAILVKPGYSAVEQYGLDAEQTPGTDVYSMAAVMYHMITGKRPAESVKRANGERLAPPSELGIDIPESVENLIMFALNVEADYRFQSAKDFADELSKVLETIRQKEKEERDKAGKWTKKMKVFVGIAAVVVAVIASVIIAGVVPENTVEKIAAEIPDFIEMEYEDAVAQMKVLGFREDQIVKSGTSPVSDKALDGKIAVQDIADGTEVKEDEKEDFVINVRIGEYIESADELARKKIKMPDLTGLTREEATKKLDNAGFLNYVFDDPVFSTEFTAGSVAKQSVAAGESVAAETEIILTLSKGKEVTTTRATTRTTTTKATTKATTTKATTKAHTTTQPQTTKAPATEPTTKAQTTTQASTTKATTTQKSTFSEQSTTKAQTTKAPTTKAPTKAPTTKAPQTQAPQTQAPITMPTTIIDFDGF